MPESKAFTVWTEAVRTPATTVGGPMTVPPSRAFTVWTATAKADEPRSAPLVSAPSHAFTVWTEAAKAGALGIARGAAPEPTIGLPPSRAFTVWTSAVTTGTPGIGRAPAAGPTIALPPNRAFTVWTREALAPAGGPATATAATLPAPRPSIFAEGAEDESAAPLSGLLLRWFAIPAAAVLLFTAFYQLSGEVKGLKNDKSELIGVKTELTGRLLASEEANRQLVEESRNLTVRLDETRQQLAQTQNANRSLERRVTDLRGEITTWKADLKDATDRHTAEKSAMQTMIASNKARIDKLDSDLDSTRITLAESEAALAAREKSIAARDKTIASLKDGAERNAATIAELMGELSAAMAQIEVIQATADARATELAAASEGLKAAAEANAKAQARILELEAALRKAGEDADNPPAPESPPAETPAVPAE